MGYEITRRQTTFWELRRKGGLPFLGKEEFKRIHFLGKEEFSFSEPVAPSFSILREHAVLIDYEFAWESISIAPPAAPAPTLGNLRQAIEARVEGWRLPTLLPCRSMGHER